MIAAALMFNMFNKHKSRGKGKEPISWFVMAWVGVQRALMVRLLPSWYLRDVAVSWTCWESQLLCSSEGLLLRALA